MQNFSTLFAQLSVLKSDSEIVIALKEYFSRFGAVIRADRFFLLDVANKRNYLIQFQYSIDAIKVANRCRLRSFGFNGILVELEGVGRLDEDA